MKVGSEAGQSAFRAVVVTPLPLSSRKCRGSIPAATSVRIFAGHSWRAALGPWVWPP